MSLRQRYQRYSFIFLGTAVFLYELGLVIGYEYVRARMCYNSMFLGHDPHWCVGDVWRYGAISSHWWHAGIVTGLLIPVMLSAAYACWRISRKWRPVSETAFYKWVTFLGLTSLGLFTLSVMSILLRQTKWPGNTINWRYDHAMQNLWGYILLSSSVLFILFFIVTMTYVVAGYLALNLSKESKT